MKLLMPVDGSAYSDAALRFIASRPFTKAQHPRIDLLNVQLPLPPRAGRAVGADIERSWHEAESRKILKPAVAALQQGGLDPANFYCVGNPGVEIADWAERHDIDLIVMGSHGRTGRFNVLVGSVANKVLAECRTPVLLLRSSTAPRRGSLRVGLAYDGSRYSKAALSFVIKHRLLFGPRFKLAVAHVVDEVPTELRKALTTANGTEFTQQKVSTLREEAFDEVLADARAALAKADVTATEQMLVGSNPGDELAAWARREKLDLLVMGSHGMSALKLAVLGSAAARVGALCDTPLLLVRPE
jgi:nucleotide-binding universal stress UspA family protein